MAPSKPDRSVLTDLPKPFLPNHTPSLAPPPGGLPLSFHAQLARQPPLGNPSADVLQGPARKSGIGLLFLDGKFVLLAILT